MKKAMINKIYNGGKLLYAVYDNKKWTTNTYIAEFGEITPRVYKSTNDMRSTQNAYNTPKLETILDTCQSPEMILEMHQIDDITTEVNTLNYSYCYQTIYIDYMVEKYGQDNLLLEPMGKTSKIIASTDLQPVAVVMGLTN